MSRKEHRSISNANNQKNFEIENERLYTINEVAKICGTSRATILRMEKYGFDRARYIDKNNGYHYYDVINVHKIMMYQMLQNLGLTVGEVTSYYRHELEPEEFSFSHFLMLHATASRVISSLRSRRLNITTENCRRCTNRDTDPFPQLLCFQ